VRAEALSELPLPVAPHDDLSFEELERTYNYKRTSGFETLFTRLLVKECARYPSARCLDIGCGSGIFGIEDLLRPVRMQAAELWGLEPDPRTEVPQIFDVVHRSMVEVADLPTDYFDVAFSVMVMEHVQAPMDFLAAVWKVLSPGGRYIFITINDLHYFGRIAKLMRKMRMDELAVRVVRGTRQVATYHYPVQYRCNRVSVVDRLARETGFTNPAYVFVEEAGPIDYFPGALKPIYQALQWKRTWRRRPDILLMMIARLEKPAR
jgi:SAM-dependent methyltransferase